MAAFDGLDDLLGPIYPKPAIKSSPPPTLGVSAPTSTGVSKAPLPPKADHSLDDLLGPVNPAAPPPQPAPPTYSAKDRDLAIRTVWGEAQGGGPDEMAAVAEVLRNRAKAAGTSITHEALKKGQFEPWNRRDRREQMLALTPDHPDYQDVAKIVDPVLNDEADVTGGATYFYAPRAQRALGRTPPAWDDGSGRRFGRQLFFNHPYGDSKGQAADEPTRGVDPTDPTALNPDAPHLGFVGKGAKPPEQDVVKQYFSLPAEQRSGWIDDQLHQIMGIPKGQSLTLGPKSYTADFGFKVRPELHPGEDQFFKANPNVGGMASDSGDVILNPYSPPDVNKDAVAKNESFRLLLKKNGLHPEFDLTPEQKASLAGTPYAKDPAAARATIAARIYSGDPSAGKVTPEQEDWVHQAVTFGQNQQYTKPGGKAFNTSLGNQEPEFRQWLKDNNVPFNPDATASDYDMRGFYKALQLRDPKAMSAVDPNDGKLHYPDYWKTPFHQTFSNESQWATPDAPKWNDKDQLVDKSGKVVFDDRAQKPGTPYTGENLDDLLGPITAGSGQKPATPYTGENLDDLLGPLPGQKAESKNGLNTALGYGAGIAQTITNPIGTLGKAAYDTFTSPEEAAPSYPGMLDPGAGRAALDWDGPDAVKVFPIDGKQVILPMRMADPDGNSPGRLGTDAELIAQYKKDGNNYGIFDTAENANAYINAKPKPEAAPNIAKALVKGGLRSVAELRQSDAAVGGGKPLDLPDEQGPETKEVKAEDLLDPKLLSAKLAYGFGKSFPTLAGAVAGGTLASLPLGGPEDPAAWLPMIAGGSVGAAVMSGAQTIGPFYAAALKENPKDPDAAFEVALAQAREEGAATGIGWAVFGIAPFKSAIKNILFQAFVAQPATSGAEKIASNLKEGKPALEGVDADQYVSTAVGTLAPVAAFHGAHHLLSAPARAKEAQQGAIDDFLDEADKAAGKRRGDIVQRTAANIKPESENLLPPPSGGEPAEPGVTAEPPVADQAAWEVAVLKKAGLPDNAIAAMDGAARAYAVRKALMAGVKVARPSAPQPTSDGTMPVTPEPGSVPRPTVTDADILKGAGHADEDIAAMAPEERAAAVKEAMAQGVKVPDHAIYNESPEAQISEKPEISGISPEMEEQRRRAVERMAEGTRKTPVAVQTGDDLGIAEAKVNTAPTDAQIAANNYAHGHVKLHGLDISIETPIGVERRGVSKDGAPWSAASPAAYGYFKGVPARANDKQHVDVYIGTNPASEKAFIIDQGDPDTGRYDEPKVVLGVGTGAEAAGLYDAAFTDGRGQDRRRAVFEVPIDGLKQWLATGDATKPFSAQARKFAAHSVTIPGILRLGGNEVPLPQSQSAGLQGLRGEGDNNLPGVEGQLPGVLPSGGTAAVTEVHAGPDQHERPLRAGKRALGDQEGAEPQQTAASLPNVPRGDETSQPVGGGAGSIETPSERPTQVGLVGGGRSDETAPVSVKPRRRPPVEIQTFIRSFGGIKDETGELAAMGFTRKSGIINPNGQSNDMARRTLQDAGYLPPDLQDQPPTSSLNDLFDAVGRSKSGEPVYSRHDEIDVARIDANNQDRANNKERKRILEEIDTHLAEHLKGYDPLTEEERLRAYELYQQGMEPDDILERIAIESEPEAAHPEAAKEIERIPFDVTDLDAAYETGEGVPAGRSGGEADAGGEARAAEASTPPRSSGEEGTGTRVAEAGQVTTEATPAGEQLVIPGTEKISDAELAQRKADEALKPKATQQAHGDLDGLFGDEAKQAEIAEATSKGPSLRDLIARKASAADLFSHPDWVAAEAEVDKHAVEETADTYSTPEAKAVRPFIINGVNVTGYDAALPKLVDMARAFAPDGKPARRKHAILLIGAPGSGKSTLAIKLAQAERAAIVDADIAKDALPEYHGGNGTQAVHRETVGLARLIADKLIGHGENFIWPRTGYTPDSIRTQAKALKDAGYTVDLINVDVDADEAARRVVKRFLETGRVVQQRFLHQSRERAHTTYDKLKAEGSANRYAELDSTEAWPWKILQDGEAVSRLFGRDGEAVRRRDEGLEASEGGQQIDEFADLEIPDFLKRPKGEGPTETAPNITENITGAADDLEIPDFLKRPKVATEKPQAEAQSTATPEKPVQVNAITETSPAVAEQPAAAGELLRVWLQGHRGVPDAWHDVRVVQEGKKWAIIEIASSKKRLRMPVDKWDDIAAKAQKIEKPKAEEPVSTTSTQEAAPDVDIKVSTPAASEDTTSDDPNVRAQRQVETEGAKSIAPAELFSNLMRGGSANLANGWRLKRSVVAGEHRIELVGPATFSEGEQVKADGVFTERIEYRTRYFVPTKSDQGEKVLGVLTAHRPVVDVGEGSPEATDDSDDGALSLASLTPTNLPKKARIIPEGFEPKKIPHSDAELKKMSKTVLEEVYHAHGGTIETFNTKKLAGAFSLRHAVNSPKGREIVAAINDALAIVNRIAGTGVKVSFAETIPAEDALGGAGKAAIDKLRSKGKTFRDTAGGYYRENLDGTATIGLAYGDPAYDLRTNAGHEAWHRVEMALLNDRERRLLKSEMPRIRAFAAADLDTDPEHLETYPEHELSAIAFQRWRREREEGFEQPGAGKLHIGIRRVFERIYQFLRNVANALRGLGYGSFEDIFERARGGEYGERKPQKANLDSVASLGAKRNTFAAEFMRDLAMEAPDLFAYRTTGAADLTQAFADIDPGVRFEGDATRPDEHQESTADKRILFKTDKGRPFHVFQTEDKVWIDVSDLSENTGGSAIYAAVGDYALNSGRTFVGDPGGMTDIALRRRTENMLSQALKHGTTQHLAPHPAQLEGNKKLGVPPLQWRIGDDLANMQSLIETSVASVAHYVPEIRHAYYDFDTRTFRTGEGEPLADAALDKWRFDTAGGRAARAGRRTLKRAILFNTLLRAESKAHPGLLERLVRQPGKLVSGTPLERTFYNLNPDRRSNSLANLMPNNLPKASTPAAAKKRGKLAAAWIRNVQPELASDRALQADARFAGYVAARQMLKDGPTHSFETMVAAWDKLDDRARIRFLDNVERGHFDKLPEWQQAQAKTFRELLDTAHLMEQAYGSTADYVEHYLPHIWEKPAEVRAHFEQLIESLGPTWFQKPRSIDLIARGVAAGFKLRTTNPAQLVLQRLYASADMIERVALLRDLHKTYGVAVPATEAPPGLAGQGWTPINGPDRQRWLIAPDIQPLWANAIEAKGLWANEGLTGDIFRGWMTFKNVWVPIKLALSLFHPLHVFHINLSQDLARAGRQVVRGETSDAARSLGDMLVGPVRAGIPGVQHSGKDARAAWLKPESERSPEEKFVVDRMTAGGFVPQLSEQLKIGAKRKLAEAWAKQDWWHLVPLAGKRAIEAFQAPIFEHWIPSLKAAAYLNDAEEYFKKHPEKLTNTIQYRAALRTIAKNVDNRFGEMNYNALFWNRAMKDAGIGSFLSLGWNLGFARGFLGGAIEPVGQAVLALRGVKPSETRRTIREANTKMGNNIAYAATAMLLAGLMTYWLSREWPDSWTDYIFPRIGGKNADGTWRRVTTMFFTREVPMAIKHIQDAGGGIEGTVYGLKDMVWNKMLVQPFLQLFTNRDYYGADIRDPTADIVTQTWQLLQYLGEQQLEPITVSGSRRAVETGGNPAKEIPLSLLGFGPAPAYASRTGLENEITALYREYVKPERTPRTEADIAEAKREARARIDAAEQSGDDEAETLARHDLGRLNGKTYKEPMAVYMFQRLPASLQANLLEDMSADELKAYLPKSRKAIRGKWRKEHPTVRP